MVSLGKRDCLTERLNLGDAQPSGPLCAGQLFCTLGWMGRQQPLVLGMPYDDRLKRAQASRGYTSSPGRLSATTTGPSFSGFPVLNIGLHLLDIGDAQLRHHALSEEWDYVRLDTALVHIKGRCLYRSVQSSQDVPGPRFGQIPFAHLPDRHAFARTTCFISRIFSLDHGGQKQLGLIARLIDGKDAVSANIDAALNSLWVAILEDEGLCAR